MNWLMKMTRALQIFKLFILVPIYILMFLIPQAENIDIKTYSYYNIKQIPRL